MQAYLSALLAPWQQNTATNTISDKLNMTAVIDVIT